MKEIVKERVIKEVTGYEATDGTMFKTKEECEKYENSSLAAIRGMFRNLMVDEPFPECSIYEDFGYGSEEYFFCVVDIKDEEDLKVALMYQNEVAPNSAIQFNPTMIGKRILVGIGDWERGTEWYGNLCSIQGEIPDLMKKLKKKLTYYFSKPEERKEE